MSSPNPQTTEEEYGADLPEVETEEEHEDTTPEN